MYIDFSGTVNDRIPDQSVIQLVNLRTVVKWSGFASLDRFIHKKYFLLYKTVKASRTIRKPEKNHPVFKWSAILLPFEKVSG
jgi:hypothetical protein